MVKIGIIGCGTVGSGVLKLIKQNGELIKEKTGKEIKVTIIADKDESKLKTWSGIAKTTTNWQEVVNSNTDIIVELIGGETIAKEIITSAIKRRKHVVTANKALLADYGEEIFKLARNKGVYVGFEASVGGGIPVIKALNEGLTANKIEKVLGIINGTANFILTQMKEKHVDFHKALEMAKNLGYAEANPELDINGTDTAHKLAILSSLAFCRWVTTKDIYCRGIEEITPLDIDFAREFGYTIKLLAIAKFVNNSIEVRVHPTMLPENHILSNVKGAFNALLIEGNFVGKTLYYGMGAGEKPTASAVLSDICNIALGTHRTIPECLFINRHDIEIKPQDKFTSSVYMRITAKDKPGVLAKISGILGKHGISIKMALQKNIDINGGVPIVMTTHPAVKGTIIKAVSEIDKLNVVTKPTFTCMIEE